MEAGRGVLPKDNEPQKGTKVAKTTQKKSLSDGVLRDKGRDLRALGFQTRTSFWC